MQQHFVVMFRNVGYLMNDSMVLIKLANNGLFAIVKSNLFNTLVKLSFDKMYKTYYEISLYEVVRLFAFYVWMFNFQAISTGGMRLICFWGILIKLGFIIPLKHFRLFPLEL